jgi:hypothetical protein
MCIDKLFKNASAYQKIAIGFASAILLTIISFSVIVPIHRCCQLNNANAYPPRWVDTPKNDMTARIKIYTDLTTAINTNTTYIYNLIVTQTLIPILNVFLLSIITWLLAQTGKEFFVKRYEYKIKELDLKIKELDKNDHKPDH